VTWRSRHLAWRRNWWAIAALAVFTAAMLALMGSDVVVPYTSSDSLAVQTRRDAAAKRAARAAAESPGRDVDNPIAPFDVARVHEITITMAPNQYEAMIGDYQRDGVKSWHPATVVIDRVQIDRVGIRLKGNSTLIGLRYSGPESPPAPGIAATLGTLTADEPNKMPFLLRFDQFVPNQRYHGVNEMALRTAGGFGGDATQLTELVANILTKESGQPYLRAATTVMSFNGSPEGFYLLIEHPDDYWAQRMVPGRREPALYKAIVGASFHYVGDDPALYEKVFNQQAESRSIGPRPMIRFLEFVERSSDSAFTQQLPDRLDVEGFARYLAFHNLVHDPDSFAGTGNNYYFIYDPGTKRMSIASWDQNLAFGRLGFGGGQYRPYYEDGSGFPSFVRNIPGFEELVPGGAIGEENILVKRFLETPKFRALYEQTYRDLFDQLLASRRADELLLELAPTIRAATTSRGLLEPTQFDGELDRDRTFLTERAAYLRTLPPVGG